MSTVTELAPGLWRWTARHPEWHPSDTFGAEVASFALVAGDHLLLVDPLLPDREPCAAAGGRPDAGDGLTVLDRLDTLAAAADHVAILLTIPYHVRSSELLGDRYAGAAIWGPPRVADKLQSTKSFTILEPGAPGPAGVLAFTIGRPRRTERPLWLPSHAAIAFGDALVTTPGGELRLWDQREPDEDRAAWYRERFVPSLAALRELDAERILTTHGAPILTGGAGALATALAAPLWVHRG